MIRLIATWLLVGTLDFLYAIGFSYWRSGSSPQRRLQRVAAGALGGDAAFARGGPTTAMGRLCTCS